MSDRDRLIELIEQAEGLKNNDFPSVEEIADYLLANDVVKVVRCKDCEYKVDALGRTMCSRTAIKKGNGWFGLTATEKNHFCSYGELKEREGK